MLLEATKLYSGRTGFFLTSFDKKGKRHGEFDLSVSVDVVDD